MEAAHNPGRNPRPCLYLNIFLRDMIALGAVYKPVEREVGIDGRFTVDAQSTSTLPGHTDLLPVLWTVS